MKKIYLLAFLIVAVGTISAWTTYLLNLIDIRFSFGVLDIFHRYNNPIPIYFVHILPISVLYVSQYAFLFLIVRRIYLLCRFKLYPIPIKPSLVAYFLYTLLLIPFLSLVLGILTLLLTIILKAGSGVPAGLVMLPSLFLPSIVFIIEIYSITFSLITRKN